MLCKNFCDNVEHMYSYISLTIANDVKLAKVTEVYIFVISFKFFLSFSLLNGIAEM